MESNQSTLTATAEPSSPAWMNRPVPVCFAYLTLAVGMTFPLAFRLTSHVPAGAVDLWQNVWNFWWWKHCLANMQAPYWTDMMFHPTGANAAFHTHSVFNMLAGLPVNLILGPTAAYNFCVLLAIWLSGFTMWLLAREVTRCGNAAFLAGVIYTFFPNHMEQTLEHLNLFSIQFIPLAIYFFVRLARHGGRLEWIGLGLAYSLNALADWHLAIKLSALLAAALVYFLIRAPRARTAILRDTALAALIAITITLPAAWPLLIQMTGDSTFFIKSPENKGVDAFYFFLPHFGHPIFGELTREAYARRAYEAAGFASYLGVVPVLLALAGGILRTRRTWMWLALLAVALLLALGRHPYFNGELHEDMNLPFGWLESVPLFKLMRIANRFMIVAGLALAMLAAFGWSAFRRAPRWGIYVATALVLMEFLWIPYPLQKVSPPEYLATIRDDSASGAVLDLPFMLNGQTVENMSYQTIHERPIAGGYLSTLPPEPAAFVSNEPALADLIGFDPPLANALAVSRLSEMGFAFIVLHKDRTAAYAETHGLPDPERDLFARKLATRLGGMTDEKFAQLRELIRNALGPAIHEDDLILVFRLPVTARSNP